MIRHAHAEERDGIDRRFICAGRPTRGTAGRLVDYIVVGTTLYGFLATARSFSLEYAFNAQAMVFRESPLLCRPSTAFMAGYLEVFAHNCGMIPTR